MLFHCCGICSVIKILLSKVYNGSINESFPTLISSFIILSTPGHLSYFNSAIAFSIFSSSKCGTSWLFVGTKLFSEYSSS